MKVKYIADHDTVALIKNKIYDVMSIEKNWYRIMTELDDDYLFPPEAFEIVEPNNGELVDSYATAEQQKKEEEDVKR